MRGRKVKRILVTILIVLIFLVGYWKLYGNWNPFQAPERIYCYSRIYNASQTPPVIFFGNKKPSYLIHSNNIFVGRRLYSMYSKGEFVPTVIYLNIGGNKYLTYSLSGGP